jgi:hypothetical protein
MTGATRHSTTPATRSDAGATLEGAVMAGRPRGSGWPLSSPGVTVRHPCSASLGLDFVGAVYRVKIPSGGRGAKKAGKGAAMQETADAGSQ